MPNPTRNWDETSSGVSMPDPPRNWDETSSDVLMPDPPRNWDETSSGVSMPDPPRNWDENTIFWDVEDWSILKDLDPELVVEKTFSHLNDRGYLRSDTSIEAFFDDDIPDNLLYAYESSGMVHLPVAKGNKHARLHRMTVYILIWAHNHRPCPSNLFILSENIKEDKQVASVVKSLNEKPFYNVVLVDSRSLLADCRLSPTKQWICDCCGVPFKKTYLDCPRPPRTPLTSPGVAVYRSARKSRLAQQLPPPLINAFGSASTSTT